MSDLENQDLIPHLNKDAIVSVQLGTGFVQQLAAIIPILIEGKSQEELASIEKLIQDKQPLAPWMASIATIQVLIKTVFEEAEKVGMVQYKPLKEGLGELISALPEDSPLSHSVPESE